MAVVPLQTDRISYRHTVTLEEYARWVEYSECAFFGVRPPNFQELQNTCRQIWTLNQRNYIARYLAEAQEEIENQIGYLLQPTFISGKLEDEPDRNERFVDSQIPYSPKVSRYRWARTHGTYKTRWDKLIAVGSKGETLISSGEAVNHATDPAIIGPVATAVTDADEIRVFYPDTDLEIHPSRITISGGQVTIEIPRCRLVEYDQLNNPSTGWEYTDLTNFQDTVDIKRIYVDPSTQVKLTCMEDCEECQTKTVTGCLRILNHRNGAVKVEKAGSCSCCYPQNIGLYYYCGEQFTPRQAKEAIVRLAHTKMPTEPCGCEVVQRLWNMDRELPSVITRERANNPFGLMDGAWIAWKWTQTLKHTRLGRI